MANGIVQFTTDIINDTQPTTRTTYSSDKIEQLLSVLNKSGIEVILGCFDNTNVPTSFVQDDQYYNTDDNKIYKATSSTVWDNGDLPKENVLYISLNDNKIYSYIKGNWGIYGGSGNSSIKVSTKSNNLILELTKQTDPKENGIYVPISKKSGNIIDNLTGQTTDANNGLYLTNSRKKNNAIQKITGSTNSSEDGLYVEDLSKKINLIDQTTKLNMDGFQEYLYLTGKLSKTTNAPIDATNKVTISKGVHDVLYLLRNEDLHTTIDDISRYNFSINSPLFSTGSYVTLKAGLTYKIDCSILCSGYASIYIVDEDGNPVSNRGYSGLDIYTDTVSTGIVKYDKDTKIYVKAQITSGKVDPIYIYPSCSFIKIEAMNALTIDPLQYIDNISGLEAVPVGTIIHLMGNNAPKHYLIADGSEYQIEDYPHLAEYFRKEFGKRNYFGGDGINTFKVPNLSGEFLRGTGNNTYTNQGNGADVGTHQDATEVNKVVNYQNLTIGIDVGSSGWNTNNYDSLVSYSGGRRYRDIGISHNPSSSADVATVRPTNTSVLYCIKAEPTYFINVIGTTIEEDLLDTPTLLDAGIEISLSDLYTNYDKIKFVWKHNHKTLGDLYVQSMDLDVKDLALNTTNAADIGSLTLTSVALNTPCKFSTCALNFKDFDKIYVVRNIAADNDWSGIKLERVIGIKTTSTIHSK